MKLNKNFFEDNEVLFIGYSGRNPFFSKMVFKAFTDAGLKVFPVNSRKGGSYDIKVYNDLNELPHTPKSAYILLNSKNSGEAVGQLKDRGVKRILFQNARTVSAETLEECSKAGIETAVACPMMAFGSGFHRIHAFLAGVKR
jgi:predicted CoA-binding protein